VLAVGVSPHDLPWVSGVAGAVMVIAVAALAWRRWGPAAAAVAGVFAGAQPLGVYYGHHVLAEADGLAGLAVALYLWDRLWDRPRSRRLVIGTTAALGLTVLLNYRFLPAVLPLLALAMWRHRGADAAEVRWHRRLLFACLLPAAALIGFYLLAALTSLAAHNVPASVERTLRTGTGVPWPFRFPEFYARTLWEFGGIAFAVSLALGIGSLARRRWSHTDLVAAGTVAGTLLFFTAAADKAPRAIMVALPFAALLAARAVTLWPGRARQWTIALVLCAACLVNGGLQSGVARAPSGIGAAGRWLETRPGTMAADRAPAIFVYTNWRHADFADPGTLRGVIQPDWRTTLEDLRRRGVRWVVVDADTWIQSGSTASRSLTTCGQPVVEFDDRASWSRLWFLDGADTLHLGYDGMLAERDRLLAASNGKTTVSIYDLEGPEAATCLR
jgi:hypothetical protein